MKNRRRGAHFFCCKCTKTQLKSRPKMMRTHTKHEDFNLYLSTDTNLKRKKFDMSGSKNFGYQLVWQTKPVLLTLLLLGTSAQLDAQDKKALKLFNEAKTLYGSQENRKAIAKLDDAVRIDPGYVDAYLLQADLFNEIDSTQLQIDALNRALALDSVSRPKAFWVLGNACFRIGRYAEALEAYHKFLESGKAGSLAAKAEKKRGDCLNAQSLVARPVPFVAVNLGDSVNSEFNDYWPSLTIDGQSLIFTRLLPVDGPVNELMPRFQEDFYHSVKRHGEWAAAEPIFDLNTAQNEGAQTVSADGKLIFYTACNQPNGFGSCDIYFARLIDGRWTAPRNAGAPVNSSSWESQPSLAANGKFLYFASNRPGGKGGMDIWRCPLNGFGPQGMPVWGKPENLGDSVNTPGNESSPYIHADGVSLYFASDDWPGLGGSDLFLSRMATDSTRNKPVNLGYPVNTCRDEQGLIVDAAGEKAYFASNRSGSRGIDLYRFDLHEAVRPTPVSYVHGMVSDKRTGAKIGSLVELINLKSGEITAETPSGPSDGEFLICLPLGAEYALTVSHPGYLFYSANFALNQTAETQHPYELKIELNPIETGSTAVLRNVFFNTGSYELLPQSEPELKQLLAFLRFNPGVSVEIAGHTDEVGTAAYNSTLSENRAKAVYNYLVGAGIAAKRLSYKGYGFSLPVASNETETGRAQNRRTEFRIIQVQ